MPWWITFCMLTNPSCCLFWYSLIGTKYTPDEDVSVWFHLLNGPLSSLGTWRVITIGTGLLKTPLKIYSTIMASCMCMISMSPFFALSSDRKRCLRMFSRCSHVSLLQYSLKLLSIVVNFSPSTQESPEQATMERCPNLWRPLSIL